jgi:monofunctional glycosyltransferase
MFHVSRQVMTSLKGPFSEQGDTAPDLDVLTGPPAEQAVAVEAVRETPEPELGPPPEAATEVQQESVPTAESVPSAAPIDAEEPGPALDGLDDVMPPDPLDPPQDIAAPEQVVEAESEIQAPAARTEELEATPGPDLPLEPAEAEPETPKIPDDIAETPAVAEEPPAEVPESAVDEYRPEPQVAELSTTEPVESEVADAGVDSVDPAVDSAMAAADEVASEPIADPAPPAPEPVAPTPLAEITAPLPEPPPPFPSLVAPAIASAIAVPPVEAPQPPTQPMAARPMPPPIAVPTTEPAISVWRVRLRRAFIALVTLAIGYATLVVTLIVVYRFVDPPRSTVMLGVHLSGQSVDYEPVPITSISSYLQRAVVTSEDARFCQHNGVDWGALAEAMQDSRGGSTITMQTAKNLFLWPSRSYIRKAIEIPVALMIDFAWPKRRILEVYLNIAEWGPGVFGAEAAAQYHFGKPASRLTQHEATLLAASLPNPIAREAGDPGRITELLASRLRGRMANSDAYVGCLGLRPMPRAQPERAPKSSPSTAKPAQKIQPWQTRTEPAKPPVPFNPWQN